MPRMWVALIFTALAASLLALTISLILTYFVRELYGIATELAEDAALLDRRTRRFVTNRKAKFGVDPAPPPEQHPAAGSADESG